MQVTNRTVNRHIFHRRSCDDTTDTWWYIHTYIHVITTVSSQELVQSHTTAIRFNSDNYF